MTNQKPLALRTAIALIVILVFAFSMYPLAQRNFYDVFHSILKDKKDPAAALVITEAKKLQDADKQMYATQAILQVADAKGIDLTKMVNGNDLQDNRDVTSLIRKRASSSIRLGLDLNGGVEFILQLVPDEEFLAQFKGDASEDVKKKMTAEFDRYRDIAIENLRKRLEDQKIYEAEIAPSGSSYVALRAPIVAKDEKLKLLNLIKMSAKLNFRLVHPESASILAGYPANKDSIEIPLGYEVLSTSIARPGQPAQTEYYLIETHSQMSGKGVADAFASKDQYGQRKIILRFNEEGAADFARVTGENVGRQLAIVLDDKLYCAPRINDVIASGSAEISGQFSEEECKNISSALVSGSFPFQIKVDAVFDTDPKLGADNVANGIYVGIFSLLMVAVFMCTFYRLVGLIATLALALNVVLVLGALAAFDATLTLPGIAGIVLTIGMAVDANVLVFERVREELRSGKSLPMSIDLGYERAFSAVLDANLTTLITSVILMYVGTGAVKGFAVTLSIGILTSLFTALFITRLAFDYIFRYTSLAKVHMMQFFRDTKFDFCRAFKKAIAVSLTAVVLSFVLFFVQGKEMLGVDFTGGTMVTFNYEKQIPQPDLVKALKDAGLEATVTYKYNAGATADNRKLEVLIRRDLTQTNASMSPKDSLYELLNKQFPDAKLSGGQESTVGGLIGLEFTKSALWALFFAILGIGLYVSLRYEFSYAFASIVALVHDLVIVTGIFVLMGRDISLTAVAALLTVLGYSMNDTVVVFDRIRENVKLKTCKSYAENINLSLNQTLNRTILTSLTTFIVVLILFIGGGVAINDFVLIMMLGIVIGTYSSIFIASPIVLWWHGKFGLTHDYEHTEVLEKVEDK